MALGALVALVIGYNVYVASDFGGDANVAESSSSEGVCTTEARACPDGTFVGRNPQNNCEFDPCPQPEEEPTIENSCCNQSDWYTCETPAEFDEGIAACGRGECAACGERRNTSISSSSSGEVEGSDGLGAVVCTQDVGICQDGTFVTRNPGNACQFFPCADGSTPQSTVN